MLTRLSIKGFKSISSAEIRFGPFTCIAGANGAGKSNLFDAIMLLKDLADHSIVEAAHKVRNRLGAKNGDLKSLFTVTASGKADNIIIEADMIVPDEVEDDFGRRASPTTTFLTYRLELAYSLTDDYSESIELVQEELRYLPRSEAKARIGFSYSRDFKDSALTGERRAPYITTEENNGISTIKISQDGNSGRPSQVPARKSPRTVLGSANTDERPTILAARREMQSWKLLQLEPSKLRAPDEFSDDPHITFDGAHIPGALERVKRFEEVSSRMSLLLPEVISVSVDVDNTRRLKTLQMEQRGGLRYKARSLSDGTLRFLALATIAYDSEATGLICLEEPENGIHPSRIDAILELLREMAVDPNFAVSRDNPLRQVVINTHSPSVVRNLVPDELLVALQVRRGRNISTKYAPMANSWRTSSDNLEDLDAPVVSLSELLDFLTNRAAEEDASMREGRLWQLAAAQEVLDFDSQVID